MAAQHGDKSALDEALAGAWKEDVPRELKAAALEVMVERRSAAFADRLAAVLGKEKDLSLKQLALGLAGSVAADGKVATGAVVAEWMDRLSAKKVPEELVLDLLDAAAVLGGVVPELQAAVASYEAARPAPVMGANGLPVLPLPKELLKGGDRVRGKEVVTNHLGGNCLACHVVEAAEGSNVGPALTGIGKLKPREYVLESLLQPGAVIAPGYGMVSVTKKDGGAVAGTVLEETAESLKVRATDGAEVAMMKSEIAMQTPPISVMPPMLGILTKREVRDVVAYLASLTKLPKKVEVKEH
jgi:putative heme-binding domain-containing protein